MVVILDTVSEGGHGDDGREVSLSSTGKTVLTVVGLQTGMSLETLQKQTNGNLCQLHSLN